LCEGRLEITAQGSRIDGLERRGRAQRGQHEVVLGRPAPIHRRLAHPGAIRDIADAKPIEAGLRDQLERRPDDRLIG
jgi:hypothetical protein